MISTHLPAFKDKNFKFNWLNLNWNQRVGTGTYLRSSDRVFLCFNAGASVSVARFSISGLVCFPSLLGMLQMMIGTLPNTCNEAENQSTIRTLRLETTKTYIQDNDFLARFKN